MRVVCLQHVPFESPGAILSWAELRLHDVSVIPLYERAARLPALSEFDMLVVMGGPMSVHDEGEFAWLKTEKTLIRSAIDANKKVLGICLGAQLIAHTLGAKVAPHIRREIGWFPISWHEQALMLPLLAKQPSSLCVLHWHGDRFEIPFGAFLLASSDACDHQAFLYEKHVLGLQFHLETDEVLLEAMLTDCADELAGELAGGGAYVQSAARLREGARYIPVAHRALFTLLDQFAAL